MRMSPNEASRGSPAPSVSIQSPIATAATPSSCDCVSVSPEPESGALSAASMLAPEGGEKAEIAVHRDRVEHRAKDRLPAQRHADCRALDAHAELVVHAGVDRLRG